MLPTPFKKRKRKQTTHLSKFNLGRAVDVVVVAVDVAVVVVVIVVAVVVIVVAVVAVASVDVNRNLANVNFQIGIFF